MENSKRLINPVTEYKNANVVVGATVFISTDDARAILSETNLVRRAAKENEDLGAYLTSIDEEDLRVLQESRDMLRQFAKSILYAPVNADITLASIAAKYI